MSVLIKGMKKPKNCSHCELFHDEGFCIVTGTSIKPWGEKRNADCPLIELPDHGDLIDRSRLIGGFADWYIQESPMYLGDSKVVAETIGDAMKAIEAAPVVIPAERNEDGET